MNAPNQLSFLPDDYLARKAQRRTNAICAALAVLVMGGSLAAFSMAQKTLKASETRHAAVENEYAEAAKPIEQFQLLQDKRKKMAHQADLSASLLEKVPRSFILADVTNALPAGVSLLDFTLDAKRKTPPPLPQSNLDSRAPTPDAKAIAAAPPVFDVTMKITGIAGNDQQVAQFINKLSKSTLFADVNLVESAEFTQGDDKLRKFQVSMTLDPNAEVRPSDKPANNTTVTETN